jgi:hypothetical protein
VADELPDAFAAYRWLWKESRMTMIEKAVLMALLVCRNNDTGRLDPSQARIAQYASASPRAVVDTLAALQSKGFIRRVRRYVDGTIAPEHGQRLEKQLGSSFYELTLPFGTAPNAVGTAPGAVGVQHQLRWGTAPGAHKLPNRTTNSELPRELTDRSRSRAPSPDVERVFEFWSKTLAPVKYAKAVKLTNDRQRAIEKGLKTHSAGELEQAIEGVRRSAFHCGDNESGAKYVELGTIFSKPAKIDGHIARLTEVPHRNGKVSDVQHDGYNPARSEANAAYIREQREKANEQ